MSIMARVTRVYGLILLLFCGCIDHNIIIMHELFALLGASV